MEITLTQAEIDGATRLHGGHGSGRDLPYIHYNETCVTASGIVFKRVWHERKPDAPAHEPIPEDFIHIYTDAELEAEYDPYREDRKTKGKREFGDCPPRYCGFCLRIDCKHLQGAG